MANMNLPFQLEDVEGLPLAFANAYFTLTGTTTAQAVYSDADLTTEHPNPLPFDENGVMPEVFLNPDYQYRLRITAEDGDLDNPLYDRDPINDLAAGLTADDIADALGYVPVDPADAQFTAEARLSYSAPLEVLHTDSAGFRIRPVSETETNHVLELDDAGKTLLKTGTGSPEVAIDTNANVPFPVGTVIYLQNVNTGLITIARESGVELREAGSSTSEDKTLAQWGYAELTKYDTNKWMIRGTGIATA